MAITRKHVVIAASVAGLYWLYDTVTGVKNTVNGLKYEFLPGDIRLVGLTQVEITVKVKVTNEGYTTLPASGMNIGLGRVAANNSTYPIAATAPAGVTVPAIAARATTEFALPLLVNSFQAAGEIWNSWLKRGLNHFRITGMVHAAGVSVPIDPVDLHF